MAIALCEPEIGIWYRDIQNRLFEVIALENEDSIEVQYIDGDITEYDRESWDMLCVNMISELGVGNNSYEESAEEELMVFPDNLQTVSWDNVIEDSDT